MFPANGGWSVAGRSSLHRRVRLFPLAAIESVELTDEPATIPPRFRVDRWLGGTWSGEPGPGRFAVHLRFDAEAAPTIRDGRWHPSQRFEALPDGRLDLRLVVDRPEDLASWVLGRGEHVEVLALGRLRAGPSAGWRRARARRHGALRGPAVVSTTRIRDDGWLTPPARALEYVLPRRESHGRIAQTARAHP